MFEVLAQAAPLRLGPLTVLVLCKRVFDQGYLCNLVDVLRVALDEPLHPLLRLDLFVYFKRLLFNSIRFKLRLRHLLLILLLIVLLFARLEVHKRAMEVDRFGLGLALGLNLNLRVSLSEDVPFFACLQVELVRLHRH